MLSALHTDHMFDIQKLSQRNSIYFEIVFSLELLVILVFYPMNVKFDNLLEQF